MIDGGLSDIFRENLPGIHFQRVETGGTGRGIPDTNYCGMTKKHSRADGQLYDVGAEGWIEFKTTDGWVLGLRPEQLGWAARRVRHGGRVWAAVRRKAAAGPRRGGAVDELWLVPGGSVIAVHDAGLRACGQGQHGVRLWRGGPALWDWGAVRALLLT